MDSLARVIVGVSTGGSIWQVMLSCLRPKCWEILFLYLFSHDENVAHSVVAKQVVGDMTFHSVFSLAANAKVASLWGPPCHPDSCSGF